MSGDPIIACPPWDEEKIRAAVPGFSIPLPHYEGEVMSACESCDEPVRLGPRSLAVRLARPDATILCWFCVAKMEPGLAAEDYFLTHLGNEEVRNDPSDQA